MHDVQPPIQDLLLHLELRDSVSQQTANAIGALENGDPMSGLIQLCCCCQTRRSRPHNGHSLSGTHGWRRWLDDPFFKSAVDDCDLDILDRDWIGIDSQHARAFARGWANAARKFGEVVG